MNRLRFSLVSLMAAVLVVAVACAGLRYASDLWASIMFTLTVGALLLGTVGSLLRHQSARAFWLGFAVFGWAYLLLVFGPSYFRSDVSPQAPPLLTSELLSYLHPKLQWEQKPAVGASNPPKLSANVVRLYDAELRLNSNALYVVNPGPVLVPRWEHFAQVDHSLLALLGGVLGGLLASYVFGRKTAPPARGEGFERDVPSM